MLPIFDGFVPHLRLPRPAVPSRQGRPGPDRPGPLARLTAPALALALAATAGLATPMAPPSVAAPAAAATQPQRPASLSPDVRGTYRLPDGRILTLVGSPSMPIVELDGEKAMLRAIEGDRFAALDDPAETLTIERDAAGVPDAVTLVRTGAALTAERDPQYTEADVSFANGGVELGGALLLPNGPGPHPAVVLVHGAEPASRESYRLLATQFARRGVAALAYDKRGVGESGGSFRGATFDDLAGDALAGLELLRRHPAIDAGRVGLYGVSQGAWIVAQAATAAPDAVAFVIAVSGSGASPAVQDRWLNGNVLHHRGLGRNAIAASETGWRMLLSTRELVEQGAMAPMPDVPGFWFHALDPRLDAAGLWEGVRQPVLGLWGELDCQVPARDSLAAIRAALDRGGNRRYSLRLLAGADHGLTLVGPCAQETSGWAHGRVRFADGYFEAIAGWAAAATAMPPVREVIEPAETTPTTLAWYQAPTDGVALLGTFTVQVAWFLGLVGVFVALAISGLVRRVTGAARAGAGPGAVGVVGLVALLAAIAAILELLLAGDVHGGLLIDGLTPFGLPIAFLVASMAAVAVAGLGLRLAVRAVRRRPAAGARAKIGARDAIAIGAAVGFAAWAAYWSLLPLPTLA